VTCIPFRQGARTKAFDFPFGLNSFLIQSLAIVPLISNFPFFEIPFEATPSFSGSRRAVVKSVAPALRSELILLTAWRFRFIKGSFVAAKQISETLTAAPSMIGPVAGLVGIEGGVVSGVMNLESLGVEAPGRRRRHDQR
jgi:hypothetical protein